MKKIVFLIIMSLLVFICYLNTNIYDDATFETNNKEIRGPSYDLGNSMGNNANNSEQLKINLGTLLNVFTVGNFIVDVNSGSEGDTFSISRYMKQYDLNQYQYYKGDIYCLSSNISHNTIYKVHKNKLSSVVDLDEDCEYFIRYKDCLYISTKTNIQRYDIENHSIEVVNDRPASIASLCFYEDKMYFVEQDCVMYELDLKSGEKNRVIDDLALYPQVKEGYLYYLSRNPGEDSFGVEAKIKRADMKTWTCETVIDGGTMFNISEQYLFYVTDSENFKECKLRRYDMKTKEDILLADEFNERVNIAEDCGWIYIPVQWDENGDGIDNPYIRAIKKDGSKEEIIELPREVLAQEE